jgi:hypothetical protein
VYEELPDFDRPTERQLRYAAFLGVQVPQGMTKWQLSRAIGDAELLKEYGLELFEELGRWNHCVDKYRYALAVYTRRKETIVDVLDYGGGARVGPRGKIIFTVAAPKLVKDPDLGRVLEWEKQFELPLVSMLYYEPLAFDVTFGLDEAGIAEYMRIVERGLAIARAPSFVRKVSPCLS